jgi:hypothetical protein
MIRVEQDIPRGLMAAGGGEGGIGTGGVAGEGAGREIPLGCLVTPAFASGSAWKYQKEEPDPKKIKKQKLPLDFNHRN